MSIKRKKCDRGNIHGFSSDGSKQHNLGKQRLEASASVCLLQATALALKIDLFLHCWFTFIIRIFQCRLLWDAVVNDDRADLFIRLS